MPPKFIAAGCIIKKDGKYLLVQEGRKDIYGLWNAPAGQVDPGETVEETAVREVREEAGYEVQLIRKIKVFYKQGDNAEKHIFEARIVREVSPTADDIIKAQWFTLKEIEAMQNKLRRPWVWEAIQMVERG